MNFSNSLLEIKLYNHFKKLYFVLFLSEFEKYINFDTSFTIDIDNKILYTVLSNLIYEFIFDSESSNLINVKNIFSHSNYIKLIQFDSAYKTLYFLDDHQNLYQLSLNSWFQKLISTEVITFDYNSKDE